MPHPTACSVPLALDFRKQRGPDTTPPAVPKARGRGRRPANPDTAAILERGTPAQWARMNLRQEWNQPRSTRRSARLVLPSAEHKRSTAASLVLFDTGPPGHYCPPATGAAQPCPAGTYGNVIGNETGLGSAACSGPCFRGHFCPEGSILPTPCPPGRFGNETGLTTKSCSNSCFPDATGECSPSQCEEGFYCPAGSTHGRQRECGEGHFCPAGSGAPRTPDDGMVGVAGGGETLRAGQADCEDCCPDGVPSCPAPRRELYASHYA